MNAPTGTECQRRGDGQRDRGIRLVKFLADGGEAKRDQEEIESVQCPAEKAGGERRAVIGGLSHSRGLVHGRSISAATWSPAVCTDCSNAILWIGQRMNVRKASCWFGCGFVFIGALYAFQRPFASTPASNISVSSCRPTGRTKGEWAFARLMFPPGPNDGYARTLRWRLAAGLVALDAGLPAGRPAFLASRSASDAHSGAVRGAAGHAGGRRRGFNWPWLYAVQVGEWGLTDEAGQSDARISAARRLLHGGRFSWRRTNGKCSRSDSVCVSGPAHCRHPGQRSDLSHRLRFGRPVSDSRRGASYQGCKNCATADRARTGAASTTTKAASWWRSPTTPTWAMPGNSRTTREYPEKFSGLAIRVGVNYLIYAMTH